MANNITYAQRKADGLCVNCGKRAAIPNSVFCKQCRETHRAANRLCAAQIQSRRRANHECLYCGVKLPPDYYYICCPKCREKQKHYYDRKKRKNRDPHKENDRRERQLPNGQKENNFN